MKKRIYISLPISGRPLKEAFEHSDKVKAALSRKGFLPVSPLEAFHGENPQYTDYIGYDIMTLGSCDGVIFCRGWEQSCGCQIENDVVMRLKAHGKKDYTVMYEE